MNSSYCCYSREFKEGKLIDVFWAEIICQVNFVIFNTSILFQLTGHPARTPLTPICNQSRTPNGILRAKQSQTIEKEILTKAKIFNSEECVMTPSKIRSVGSAMKENSVGRIRKGVCQSERSSGFKQARTQWDQDKTVII